MSEKERDRTYLAELQAMSTNDKIQRTMGLIGEWYNTFDGKVYVSLSGGKDSTVLADLVGYWCAMIHKPLNLCFSNTGLEYPEIQKHVKVLREYLADKHHIDVNLDVVRPKIMFSEVISTYGYPLISKEVSEAIYYARRIRKPDEHTNQRNALSGTLPLNRERETARGEACCLNAQSLPETDTASKNRGGRQAVGFPRKERQELLGIRPMFKETQIKRQKFLGRYQGRRVGIAPIGEIGEGGVFSRAEEQFGNLSMFNKEKWLPLARDLPVPVSHICCNKQKKAPLQEYQKKTGMKPFLGTMAEESRLRRQAWIRHGCNAFDGSKQTSQPLSFWTEQDILRYTLSENLPLASVYGEIVAVDEFGNEYAPDSLIGDCGTLKCTGCTRTGQ